MTAAASSGDQWIGLPSDPSHACPIPLHRRVKRSAKSSHHEVEFSGKGNGADGVVGSSQSNGQQTELGFQVPTQVLVQRGRAILPIYLDPNRYDGVWITGLPRDVWLSRGQLLSESSALVAPLELAGLSIQVPESPSNRDFLLSIAPIRRRVPLREWTRHVNVRLDQSRGMRESLWIPSFGIVAGNSGPVPLERGVDSPQCSLVIKGLPPFIALSTGNQIGDEWFLNFRQLDHLWIHAMRCDDPSDWKPYYNYLYQAHPVAYAVESTSADGQVTIDKRTFVLYTFQT